MKRNFMKKAVAVSLSAAMAFSLSAATALTASAASTVSMAKKATVTVGKNKTLKVTTNKKWKVTKVGTTDKKYVTIKKLTATKVRLTGKKATKASSPVTVRVRVKKKTGNKAEKVLKCKVTVKKAASVDTTPTPTPTPDTPTPTPTPEVKTSADVANQAELDAALADSNIKTINIKTSDETSFEIKEGTYDVDLTVNAANASVTNSATFKSITIEAISSNTWTEKGKNNTFTLKAPSARFVLDPAAVIKEILVTMKSALKIEGNAAQPVPVKIDAAAEGSSVASEAVVEIQAAAQVSVTLEAAAKGSKIQLIRGSKEFSINVTNNTGANIDVTDNNGKKVATATQGTSSPKAEVLETTTPTPTPTPGTTPTKKTDLTDAYLYIKDIAWGGTSVNGEITTSPSAIKTQPKVTIKISGGKAVKAETTTGSAAVVTGTSDISGTKVGYLVNVNDSDNLRIDGFEIADGSEHEYTLPLGLDKVTGKFTGSLQYTLNVKAYVEGDNYNRSSFVDLGSITINVTDGGVITIDASAMKSDAVHDDSNHDDCLKLNLKTGETQK